MVTTLPSPFRDLPENPDDDDIGEECEIGSGKTCTFDYRGIVFMFGHVGFDVNGNPDIWDIVREQIEGGKATEYQPNWWHFLATKDQEIINANLDAISDGQVKIDQEGNNETFNVVSAIYFPSTEFSILENGKMSQNIDELIEIVEKHDGKVSQYIDNEDKEVILITLCSWKREGQSIPSQATSGTAGRYVFVLEKTKE